MVFSKASTSSLRQAQGDSSLTCQAELAEALFSDSYRFNKFFFISL